MKWDSLRFPRAQALRLLVATTPAVAPAQAVPVGVYVNPTSRNINNQISTNIFYQKNFFNALGFFLVLLIPSRFTF